MGKNVKLNHGGFLAMVMLSLGFALTCGGVAQAAPQYVMDCTKCHAMPPGDSGTTQKDPFTGAVPGNHGNHATSSLNSCAKCHGDVSGYGNSHLNKTIEVDNAVSYSRSIPAGFVNQTSVPPNLLGTCATAACHSNGKGVMRATPVWGNMAAATCDSCHDSQPATNKHGKHVSTTTGYGYGCVKCHSDHNSLAGAARFAHATSAMWGQAIDVHFTAAPNSGGTFTPNAVQANASCSAIYCHSDGKASPTTRSITWGGSVTCASCHGDASTDTLSGKHAQHVHNAAVLGTDYGCVTCHAATVSDNSTIANKAKHADGVRDVSAACTVCHTNGKGVNKAVALADWSGATTLDCKGCHGSEAAPAFTSVAGEPNYTNAGAGLAGANTHQKHVTGAADCANCHSKTTTTGTAIIAGSQHTDGFVNFTSGNGKTFGKAANKNCSNISCHSGNGRVKNVQNAQWGATLNCAGCHATANLSGAHSAHVTTRSYQCESCHFTTATGSTAIKTPALHMNYSTNVTLASGTYNGNLTCTTSACHGSGTPNWKVPATGQCGSCHQGYSDTNNGLIATKAHTAHFTAAYGPGFNSTTAGNACVNCHTYTGANSATHPNGTVNMAAGFSANGTCVNCHKQITNWATGRVTCESCHSTAGGALSVIGTTTAPDKTSAATSGHGKAGIAQACTACHDNTKAHISGVLGDNDRLLATLGSGNTNCTACHDNAGTVTARTFNMKAHRLAGSGSLCADCHDPHGTTNSMMVNTSIGGTSGVSFTGNTTFVNGSNNGVCQVCHTTTQYFRANGTGAAHVDSTTNCLDCHKHNPASGQAFSVTGGCDACHGYPPAPRNVAVAFGVQNNWSSARFEDYSGGGGAHVVAAHLAKNIKPADGWAPCLACHAGGDASHTKALPVRTHVSNISVKVDPQYRFSNAALITYTSARLTNDGTNKTGGCFNVSCHFKTSPKWSTER